MSTSIRLTLPWLALALTKDMDSNFLLQLIRFNPTFLVLSWFQSQFSPTEVVQWSNHRVMEWLRSVDLAEYAPNLRGSGVHGGLIVS